MGLMNKMKFWKKDDDMGDLGDFGDMGNFDSPTSNQPDPFSSPDPINSTTNQPDPFNSPDPMNDPMNPPSTQHNIQTQHPMNPTNPYTPDPYSDLGSPTQENHTHLSSPASTHSQEDIMPSQATQNIGTELYNQGTPIMPTHPLNQQQNQPMQNNNIANINIEKDLELINAKLDSIRVSIDSLSTRLATIERLAGSNQSQKYSW